MYVYTIYIYIYIHVYTLILSWRVLGALGTIHSLNMLFRFSFQEPSGNPLGPWLFPWTYTNSLALRFGRFETITGLGCLWAGPQPWAVRFRENHRETQHRQKFGWWANLHRCVASACYFRNHPGIFRNPLCSYVCWHHATGHTTNAACTQATGGFKHTSCTVDV